MVKDMRSKLILFVAGLGYLSSKEGRATMLIRDMDISRLMKQKGPGLSSASAPAHKNKCEYNNQNFRAKPAFSQGSVAQGGSKPLACAKCGRNHLGICREGSTGCFKCRQTGHFMRDCPKNKQGNGNEGNKSQSSSVAPPDWASPSGATFGTGGGANHLFTINSRQEQKDSPDVVTSKGM
ncbi:hypothetical protein MTR67_027617 [Solanum verrucosum]|uniref:CCHC-type domain-containing protein n=1 Tax=Solanum verrucosum TaxID=315347 RepID=A0AAF0R5F7_SOLVR|nr:hypothetical protein MTR67_027617 [Solanum verrucosum]